MVWAFVDAPLVEHTSAWLWQSRQAQRLAALLRAAEASPLLQPRLREAGGGSPHERLRRLRPTRRGELMAHFDAWVTDPALRLSALRAVVRDPARHGEAVLGRYLVWESSGSSGEPGLFVQDTRSMAVADALECTRGPVSLAGLGALARLWQEDMRVAYVGALDGHFAGVVSFERARQLNPWFGAQARAFCFMQPPAELAAQLNEFAPTVLATYPSMAWVLAQAQAEGRLHIEPEVVWTGGETLTPGLRRAISERFHAPVRDTYGASECLTIASECRCGRLHLNADWVILEPVDAQGRAVPEGVVGETTLLTNLANHVQPILRYDLGDCVRFVPGRCACGSALPVIEVQGRCDDVLTLDDGQGHAVHLPPLALTSAIEDGAGVFDFRLRQSGRSALQLDLDGRAARGPAAAALRAYLRRQGLGSVSLRTHAMAAAPARGRSGKQRRVICQRPR